MLLRIGRGQVGVGSGEAAARGLGLRVFLVLQSVGAGLIGVSGGGAIAIGIRLGVHFLLLGRGVVAFGLGLSSGGVASGVLRVAGHAFGVLALAICFGAIGFGAAHSGVGGSDAISIGERCASAHFVDALHGDFTRVFGSLHDEARGRTGRFLSTPMAMSSACFICPAALL